MPAVKKGDAATDYFSDQVFGRVSWEIHFPEIGLDPQTPVSLL